MKNKSIGKEYASHPSLHDWENWSECNGVNGYTTGAKHTTGVRQYNNQNRDDMGIHTIYSGSAIRRVEQYNGTTSIDLVDYHCGKKHSFTRIDLAIDLFNSGLNVEKFEQEFLAGNVNTKLKSASKVKNLTSKGYTLYIGSRKKIKKLVTVYNKAAEQGLSGDWIRIETRIMGKPATQASILLSGSYNKGSALVGIVKGIIDFTTIDEWKEITENVDIKDIGSISSDKGDTRRWLIEQCVPALAKEIALDSSFADVFNDAVIQKLVEMSSYQN